MSSNLKDILSNLSTDIDQETLLLYLQGKLSDDKKHELEQKLVDSEFANDALDGLREIRDQQQIQFMVDMLNRDLKKKTEKKRMRREKMKLKDQSWIYISLIILLLQMRFHSLSDQSFPFVQSMMRAGRIFPPDQFHPIPCLPISRPRKIEGKNFLCFHKMVVLPVMVLKLLRPLLKRIMELI